MEIIDNSQMSNHKTSSFCIDDIIQPLTYTNEYSSGLSKKLIINNRKRKRIESNCNLHHQLTNQQNSSDTIESSFNLNQYPQSILLNALIQRNIHLNNQVNNIPSPIQYTSHLESSPSPELCEFDTNIDNQPTTTIDNEDDVGKFISAFVDSMSYDDSTTHDKKRKLSPIPENEEIKPAKIANRKNVQTQQQKKIVPKRKTVTSSDGIGTTSNCSSSDDSKISSKVSEDGKKSRRFRTIFTNQQLVGLENAFCTQQYMVGNDRVRLAESLGLSVDQVKVWFQNRRIKDRKELSK
ncbi:hypothetical protein SNEBB_009276 [Seison nebaliae]|nr:hypothetical protein SNEBB_009276 [Seison nebaliae]